MKKHWIGGQDFMKLSKILKGRRKRNDNEKKRKTSKGKRKAKKLRLKSRKKKNQLKRGNYQIQK